MSIEAPQQIVCVLGMHRSGTSCLTGTLQACGLFLGKHSTWNKHNTRGNRENEDIVSLHDAILADNGGSWDTPPSRIRWSEEHLNRAREIVARHADQRQWGFKDPRTLLVLEGWRKLFPGRLFCIGIYRNPWSVAESLHRRGAFPRERGIALWTHYNRLLLRECASKRVPLMSFDWSADRFHDRLEPVLQELRLQSTKEAERFYEEELRSHNIRHSAGLPLKARLLYWRLRHRSSRATTAS